MISLKKVFPIVCVSVLAACSADNECADNTSTSHSKQMIFSASIDMGKDTRTAMGGESNNTYPVWNKGDLISVFNTVTKSTGDFSVSDQFAGSRSAEFKGEIDVDDNSNKFYALYSASTTAKMEENGAVTISGSIPAIQSTTPGFHPEYHFMTACTTGNAFKFKMQCRC